MTRPFVAAAIVLATIACGRSREIVSPPSTSTPTAPTTPLPAPSIPRNPSVDQTRVSGQVSGLAGSCPSIMFTVGSVKVSTTTTTAFLFRCADVVNGAFVEVEGTKLADGSIQAERIEVRHVR